MDEALAFMSAAPFIAMIIGFLIKSIIAIPPRFIPLVALVATVVWGLVLVWDGRWTGDVSEFILTAFLVAFTAAGFQSVGRTYIPNNFAGVVTRFGPGANGKSSGGSVAPGDI